VKCFKPRKVDVKHIYNVVICLRFATNAGYYRKKLIKLEKYFTHLERRAILSPFSCKFI